MDQELIIHPKIGEDGRIVVNEDGTYIPLAIEKANRIYPIQRIIRSERYVLRKIGKVGRKYLVEIRGQQRIIYHCVRPVKWIVERPDGKLPLVKGTAHCCADIREMYCSKNTR